MVPDRRNAAHPSPVTLGRISGLYGVRGWIRVFSYTDPREALLEHAEWLLGMDGRWIPATVAEGRKQGKSVVARLERFDDRDAAARTVGAEIAVPRDKLPATKKGEYYWADLEGLQVRHRDGRVLGHVDYLLATGANDVMVVLAEGAHAEDGGAGDREILIPFVPGKYVLDVDLEGKTIDVDWEWD